MSGWCSGGQGFEIGFERRIDTIRGITFRNCDIIRVRGGGVFTIHNGDRARIEFRPRPGLR